MGWLGWIIGWPDDLRSFRPISFLSHRIDQMVPFLFLGRIACPSPRFSKATGTVGRAVSLWPGKSTRRVRARSVRFEVGRPEILPPRERSGTITCLEQLVSTLNRTGPYWVRVCMSLYITLDSEIFTMLRHSTGKKIICFSYFSTFMWV